MAKVEDTEEEQLYVSYSQTNLLRFNGSIAFTSREPITKRRHKAAQKEQPMKDKNGNLSRVKTDSSKWKPNTKSKSDDKVQHRTSAYILKDDGGLDYFVSTAYVQKLREKVALLQEIDAGWMRVRTADNHHPKRAPKRLLKLNLKIGSYKLSTLFTVFDLADYDIILGKRWMQHIKLRHNINNKTHVMWVWDEPTTTGIDPTVHILKGLQPHAGRTG